MEFRYLGVYVNITEKNIHIHNSYKITNPEEKYIILNEIFSHVPVDFPRSFKSALREWKAHNVLYKLGVQRERTMHTDIEAKPKLISTIGYFFLSLLDFLE